MGTAYGRARSNAERKARHKRIHGTSELPPRGTGRGYTADAIKSRMEKK